METAVKLILDDLARRVLREQREGRAVGADNPIMVTIDGLRALYPSIYKTWDERGSWSK